MLLACVLLLDGVEIRFSIRCKFLFINHRAYQGGTKFSKMLGGLRAFFVSLVVKKIPKSMKLIPLILSLFILSCSAQSPTPQEATESAQEEWYIAPNLNDGWSTTNPASVGLNEDSLGALLTLIRNTPPNDFRALIVSKNGKLVVEEYFNSFMNTNIHDIRSAGKSVTSILAGVAIDKGLFKKSDKVLSVFPDYKNISNNTSAKSEIIVEDLLVMSSGLASDDYVDDSPGAEGLMFMADNFLKFALDLPMDFEPGSRYAYSSVVAYLLGCIIEKTSGQTLEDFAKASLFGSLGIEEFYWQRSPEGHNTGMGNLYFQARDFAKLGQLMLDKGKWNGQQYISEKWVEDSFRKKFDIDAVDPFSHGYGYMWYIAQIEVKGKMIDFYFASGNGGNKIFIIPEHNMVVATLSSAYGQGYGHRRSHNILTKVLEAL